MDCTHVEHMEKLICLIKERGAQKHQPTSIVFILCHYL